MPFDRARSEGSVTTSDSNAQVPTRWHRRPRVRRLFRSLLSPSKFALVGISGIVVNEVALHFFVTAMGQQQLLWAALLSSQVSTFTNFVLIELWVFRGREVGGHLLWRYLTFNLLNLVTQIIRLPTLHILTEVAGIHYLISNLVALGLTFGVRYLVADNWIWAGRDRRDQVPIDGSYQYDVHGIVRITSTVHLPELAAFNVTHRVEPDIVISRRAIGGGPHLHVSTVKGADGVIRYREHFGLLSAAFDVRIGDRVELDANWLLTWSHHVLYTNMVEPLLRFWLVSRGYVLLHCAAIDAERGAIIMSAQTDTGKTSTVLRLLMQRSWGFISDDMAILTADGEILSYPKPMTLSSHTMSAVNDQALPRADRFMLAIRSRVHSKGGRSAGHALGRLNVPIVTINSWVQLIVPPPKYHVQSLIDCDMTDRAPIDSIVLMERGSPPLAEEPAFQLTIDRLIENTDDAYTFPPFAALAPLIAIGDLDHDALRRRERQLLETAVARAWRVRVRVVGHNWSELIPTLVERHRAQLPPAEMAAAAREADAAIAAEVAAADAPVGAGRAP
jgi:dolichol-phosphate mannosyltransferase